MGTYATATSFPQLLPNLLSGNSVSDSTGVAIIEAHITRAEGMVNSYISSRYSSQVPTGGWGLPWGSEWGTAATPIPPILRTLTEDLTSYYVIRGSYVQDGERKNNYGEYFKEAIKILEQIRDGKMPLALTSGAIVPHVTAGKFKSSTQNYAPTFDEGNPEKWDIDPDKEDDIQSAK